MKVLHVVESFEIGGLEKFVIDLGKLQSSRGHQVYFASLSESNPMYSVDKMSHIPLKVFPKTKPFDFSLMKQIAGFINENGIQIVHTHNAVTNYYLALAKTIFPYHAVLINTRHGLANSPFSWRRELFFKASLIRTSMVVFVCETARQLFIQKKIVSPDKSYVILNGINIEEFTSAPIVKDAFLKIILDWKKQGNLILGTVGRLNPVKNHSYLLEIFELLRKKTGTPLKLVFVGDGPKMTELQSLVRAKKMEDEVLFTGAHLSPTGIMQQFDLFLLTSFSEGLPITLIEAMSLGLPIATTKVGGIPDIVMDGINGVFIPLNQPKIAAEIISQLLQDKALLEFMRQKNKDNARRHFDMSVVEEKYEKIYRMFLK